MITLGISAFYHDSAAALVADGEIIAAAQEERFVRKKHTPEFPIKSIEFCLKTAGLKLNEVDSVIFYDKPLKKLERLITTHAYYAPKGFNAFSKIASTWLSGKILQKRTIISELKRIDLNFSAKRLIFADHHLSHAASAFFPSPFNEAVILTLDGVGEWATTAVSFGKGSKVEVDRELHYPHSLGLLYTSMTTYLGFKANSGEYKVMGLAPYGTPIFVSKILNNLIQINHDGTFHINMDYFNYATGLTMTNNRFHRLFGGEPRKPNEPLLQRHMDLAASIQATIEKVVIAITRSLSKETKIRNLCLAGGVALNCVANGKILRDEAFKNIWIQPAAGDAGSALGAALLGYYQFKHNPRKISKSKDSMHGSYLGPNFEQEEIEKRLKAVGAIFKTLKEEEFFDVIANAIANEKAVGWFQGRMEFGPRALGGRSILADPRSSSIQRTLNLKVKYRESFRPFAPSVLYDCVEDWFELKVDSPYMLLVTNLNEKHKKKTTAKEESLFGIEKLNVVRSNIPAITHVDYSARVQTVHPETNPRFYKLISKFKEITHCPILVNTSFNVRGEPIVCSPEDAFNCFMGTEIELLAIGNCVLFKEDQNHKLKLDYSQVFEPD